MRTVYTPGHCSDHMSFIVDSDADQQRLVFSGDVVLASPRKTVDDIAQYKNNVNSLLSMGSELKEVKAVDFDEEDDFVDQLQGVSSDKKMRHEYLKAKQDSQRCIKNLFASAKGELSKKDLYEHIYGARNLTGPVQIAADNELDLQLSKLLDDNFIQESPRKTYSL
mmetsp:Transcript_106720/g.147732  ORF Transcript_106720/g.147732 Transcript_106720/m.147732 type:complete len:166 (-) Transcript_106720:77-574(-)